MRTFFIAIVVARLFSTAGAQAPKAFDDMWPAWSPDGRFIVFSSTRDGDPEIYVMTSTGTSPRRLTTSPGRDAHPSWSPDGTKIVFQSPRQDGHTQIFVMDADGRLESTGAHAERGLLWRADLVTRRTPDCVSVHTRSRAHLHRQPLEAVRHDG
jgi:dipeptidyl aminopeptidase/acylaminoacyl peptidase